MEHCTPSAGFLQRSDIQWLSPPVSREFDLCRQPTCCCFSGAVPLFTAEFPHPRQMLINILMYPLLWYICLLSYGLTPFCNSFAPFNSFCSNASRCPHAFPGLRALSIQDDISCWGWQNCCHALQEWQSHTSWVALWMLRRILRNSRGNLTELRWLEEMMMQMSIGKNKNATQTVEKWVMRRKPCHSEWLSKGVSSVHWGECSSTIMVTDNISLSVPVKDAPVNKTNSTLMFSPQKTIWQQS